MSGRSSNEYVSGNGDRPNALIVLDQGGGYVHKQWVELHESVYLHPIATDMYIGMAHYGSDTPTNDSIAYVLATLLGNYMIINQHALDRDTRYDRLTTAMRKVVPLLSLSTTDTGGYKVPYYNLWLPKGL